MVPPASLPGFGGSDQSNRSRGCARIPSITFAAGTVHVVSRPTRYEHFRYLGDKRTQVVYDLDLYGTDAETTAAVDDILAEESGLAISPQTLAEARNRNYRPHRSIAAVSED